LAANREDLKAKKDGDDKKKVIEPIVVKVLSRLLRLVGDIFDSIGFHIGLCPFHVAQRDREQDERCPSRESEAARH